MTASGDDHRASGTAAGPAATRLALRGDGSARTILDGAWWPRSRDPVAELADLLAALDARQWPITRIMLNSGAWDDHPRRVGFAGRTVRVGWFATLDANLVIATTSSERRIDLLVISPDASSSWADTAMSMACNGAGSLTATAILAAVSTRAAAAAPSQRRTTGAWESGGSEINGHRPEIRLWTPPARS